MTRSILSTTLLLCMSISLFAQDEKLPRIKDIPEEDLKGTTILIEIVEAYGMTCTKKNGDPKYCEGYMKYWDKKIDKMKDYQAKKCAKIIHSHKLIKKGSDGSFSNTDKYRFLVKQGELYGAAVYNGQGFSTIATVDIYVQDRKTDKMYKLKRKGSKAGPYHFLMKRLNREENEGKD